MARKSKTETASEAKAAVELTAKDKKTLGSIRNLAEEVVQSADRLRAPYVEIPSRSLSNVRFNQSKRIVEMGSGTNRRELFNLNQAKSYMQTLLVGSGCKQLIDQGKTTSIRGLFYLLKHTIAGTSEETFRYAGRVRSDHRRRRGRSGFDAGGTASLCEECRRNGGPITLVDSGDEIDCSRMGSGRLQRSVDCRKRDRAVQEERGEVRAAR
jgi:DNA topoisomerase-6 subunit A